MIHRDGDRLVVSGPVTLSNVTQLLHEVRDQVGAGAQTIDLGGVTELNSSLLAVMLAWVREARRNHAEIVFVNMPESLKTMARLYGVLELLPTGNPRG